MCNRDTHCLFFMHSAINNTIKKPEEFAEEIFDIMTNIIESQNIEQGLELCQDDEYVTTNPKKKIKSKK